MNVNTAGCDRRAFIGCILIIALTFHRVPRTLVYTQNVPLTAYLNPASLFARREGTSSEVLAMHRNAYAQFKSSIVCFRYSAMKSSVMKLVLSACLLQPSLDMQEK